MSNQIKQLQEMIAKTNDPAVKKVLSDSLKAVEAQEKNVVVHRKNQIKRKLMIRKAEAAGLAVSDEEIDKEYEKMYK
jgi:hypothetical protein